MTGPVWVPEIRAAAARFTAQMRGVSTALAAALDAAAVSQNMIKAIHAHTEDSDMEAFAALPDCDVCGGTGKDVPAGFWGGT